MRKLVIFFIAMLLVMPVFLVNVKACNYNYDCTGFECDGAVKKEYVCSGAPDGTCVLESFGDCSIVCSGYECSLMSECSEKCYGKKYMESGTCTFDCKCDGTKVCTAGECGVSAQACNACQSYDSNCNCVNDIYTGTGHDGTSCCYEYYPIPSNNLLWKPVQGQEDNRILCYNGKFHTCDEETCPLAGGGDCWSWIDYRKGRCDKLGSWACPPRDWRSYNGIWWEQINIAGMACGSGKECNSAGECVVVQPCTTYYKDVDDDSYGTSDSQCLYASSGYYDATQSGDCNDGNSDVYPGALELCDGIDNQCSGTGYGEIDEGCEIEVYWKDMAETKVITEAEINDMVKIVAAGENIQEGITFDIYQCTEIIGIELCILGGSKVAEDISATMSGETAYAIWTLPDSKVYYAKGKISGMSVTGASDELVVSDVPSNSKPVIVLTLPDYINDDESTYDIALGNSVSFDASSSYDPDGIIESYSWRLEDENSTEITTLSGATTSHIFAEQGAKYFTLTVTDNGGAESVFDGGVLIDGPGNDAPLAILSCDLDSELENTVNCDASDSIDDDTASLFFKWYIDGYPDSTYDDYEQITKTFDSAGTHTIEVIVDDGVVE